jgi:regulator of sigma E protease
VLLAVITLASIGKLVTFLVMLSILIVLHEYGHFIVARRNGVRVNEFAVGMGPKIVGWRSPRTGTLYSIRALPIGGYCAMEGEDNKSTESEQQREFRSAVAQGQAESDNFQAKKPWRRLGIVLAGPFANFILAYVILLAGALIFGAPSDHISKAIVTGVQPGSPAARHGLRPGDRIVSVQVDGKNVTAASALVDTIHASLGKTISVTYDRGGADQTIVVQPERCPQNPKMGCIGFAPDFAYERVGFAKAIEYSGLMYASVADQVFSSLAMLVTQFSKYAGQVSGVVGMGQAAAVVQDFGWGPYLTLAATISFALGLFNLLPVPALDGGRAAFIIAELLRGKPVDPEKEALVHIAGFAALMALMLIVAVHDIARIVSGQGVF